MSRARDRSLTIVEDYSQMSQTQVPVTPTKPRGRGSLLDDQGVQMIEMKDQAQGGDDVDETLEQPSGYADQLSESLLTYASFLIVALFALYETLVDAVNLPFLGEECTWQYYALHILILIAVLAIPWFMW
eukprot:CAMPEP_0201584400 /NCGR_PEP_ID=MMETSP0190_2-20130828/110249_1 /ASSEMBLY_ACC=CAM_ASM_000263 /TAXON_ID=37353 /ORGANISM="Rosalina sp." /LENGTH=129 /DNA_ID=CAMNT_0048028297 /DNA_START=80 /DNA_END=466 /DNA_ORIENTATION=+